MKVGDRLNIALELECLFAPGCGSGKAPMRISGCYAKVTDDYGRELGTVGGEVGARFGATLSTKAGTLYLSCPVVEQWEAIISALESQYGIVVAPRDRKEAP